jgi:hypothetical protein
MPRIGARAGRADYAFAKPRAWRADGESAEIPSPVVARGTDSTPLSGNKFSFLLAQVASRGAYEPSSSGAGVFRSAVVATPIAVPR